MSGGKDVEIEIELLNSFYKEVHEEFGEKVMIDIYKLYRGLILNIPKKLYEPEKVKNYLKCNYKNEVVSKEDIKKLVIKFGYSERHIHRLINKEI